MISDKQVERVVKAIMNDTKDWARRFADSDSEGDRALTFDQFYALHPQSLREKHDLETFRVWFSSADLDGNGELSITQFFLWALNNALLKHGEPALRSFFKKFDPDLSGFLDAIEFTRVCDALGFGLVASELFRILDPDMSGTISYAELMSALKQQSVAIDRETNKKIKILILAGENEAKQEHLKVLKSTKGWSITGETYHIVRAQMNMFLKQSGANVLDLVKCFDSDASGDVAIDEMEFYYALRKLFGFRGSIDLSDEVFASLDQDGDGEIGFDELYDFIQGSRHSLDKRHKRPMAGLTLASGLKADYTWEQVAWDSDALRVEICKLMERSHLGSTDLVRAWDRSRNGSLEEKEFMHLMKALFKGHEALWKAEIEILTKQLFDEICAGGTDSKVYGPSVSVTELEIWLRSAPKDALTKPPPMRTIPFKPLTPREEKIDDAAAQGGSTRVKFSKARPQLSPVKTRKPSASPRLTTPSSPFSSSPTTDIRATPLASPIFRAILLQQKFQPERPWSTQSGALQVAGYTSSGRRIPVPPPVRGSIGNVAMSHAQFWNGSRVTRPYRVAVRSEFRARATSRPVTSSTLPSAVDTREFGNPELPPHRIRSTGKRSTSRPATSPSVPSTLGML